MLWALSIKWKIHKEPVYPFQKKNQNCCYGYRLPGCLVTFVCLVVQLSMSRQEQYWYYHPLCTDYPWKKILHFTQVMSTNNLVSTEYCSKLSLKEGFFTAIFIRNYRDASLLIGCLIVPELWWNYYTALNPYTKVPLEASSGKTASIKYYRIHPSKSRFYHI